MRAVQRLLESVYSPFECTSVVACSVRILGRHAFKFAFNRKSAIKEGAVKHAQPVS